jgi:hypothetical protein
MKNKSCWSIKDTTSAFRSKTRNTTLKMSVKCDTQCLLIEQDNAGYSLLILSTIPYGQLEEFDCAEGIMPSDKSHDVLKPQGLATIMQAELKTKGLASSHRRAKSDSHSVCNT